MAFRKRFSRSRRRFSKPVARKKTTWVTSLVIDPCNPLNIPMCIPSDGCCTTKWKMVLMDQNTMQGLFSDRLTVVRILGDLWIVPDPHLELSADAIDAYNRLAQIQAECFFGLKRGEITTQSASATSDIWDVTGTDLSEFQWMKTWAHRWEAFDGSSANIALNVTPLVFNLSIPVSKPDVHTYVVPGTPFCNTLTTGSGQICVETEDNVECVSCEQTIAANSLIMNTVHLETRPNWHVHLDVKKRIPMRENQELYLMFNGRNPSAGSNNDFSWQVKGNLRALVQMG